MKLSFDDLLTHLIREKDFDAAIANAMQKIPTETVENIGIGIHQGRVVLYYNPKWLETISFSMATFHLKHEMGHIIWDHLPRFFDFMAQVAPEEREQAEAVWGLAVDCANNCVVRQDATLWHKVRKGNFAVPEKVGPMFGLELEADQSTEYYWKALIPHVKVIHVSFGFIDGTHKLWCQVEEGKDGATTLSAEEMQGLAHVIRSQLKNMLRQVKRNFEQGHGSVPAGVKEWLDEYLANPVVPWWEILQNYIASQRVSKPRRSVQRPSRPLLALSEEDILILPAVGRLVDARFRIFFYADTSGSMGDEELIILFSEFQSLLNAEEDMEIRYMMGDTETHFDKVFRGGDAIEWQAIGRGGTDFDAYFRHMSQYVGDEDTAPDLIIIGTDGGCSPVSPEFRLPPEVPVLWLLTNETGYGTDGLRAAGYGDILVANKEHRFMRAKQ